MFSVVSKFRLKIFGLISLTLLSALFVGYDYPTIPWTFATKEIISSSKTNANNAAWRNGMSDGTKKMNMAEILIGGVQTIPDTRVFYGKNELHVPSTAYPTLQSAITAATTGSTSSWNIVIDSAVNSTATASIPANVRQITFRPEGYLNITGALTFTGQYIETGPNYIFRTGTVTGNISNNEVYPEWFGASANDINDDIIAMNKASSSFEQKNIKLTKGLEGYYISSTWFIPDGVGVDGGSSTIVPISGHSFTAGYIIIINSIDGISWKVSYPYKRNIFVGGFVLDNRKEMISGLSGIRNHSNLSISHINSFYIDCTVSISTEYLDQAEVSYIYSENKTGATRYVVETGYLGDGRNISQIHLYNPVSVNTAKSVLIGGGHNTASIKNIINGDIYINHNGLVKISDVHIESLGKIVIDGATVEIENLYMYVKPGEYPITINDFEKIHPSIRLKQCQFIYSSDYMDDFVTENYEINAAGSVNLTLDSCYRAYKSPISVEEKVLSGIKVRVDSSELVDFSNLSKLYSRHSIISNDNIFPKYDIEIPLSATNIVSSITKSSHVLWDTSTATYNYKAQYIIDPIRKIGSNESGSDAVVNFTSGSSGALIILNDIALYQANLRLFRGDSNIVGTYKYVVNVSMVSGYMFDNGLNIMGNLWESRTEGPIDAIFPATNYMKRSNGTIECEATTYPSIGTWSKGDIIRNSNPSDGSPSYWICTVAGTPGTWKTGSILQDTAIQESIIIIPTWNMQVDASITIPETISIDKVIGVSAVIIPDGGGSVIPLNAIDASGISQGSVDTVSGTGISLFRLTGGSFDATNYNDPAQTPRGYIILRTME
jgi:hypothetical protein